MAKSAAMVPSSQPSCSCSSAISTPASTHLERPRRQKRGQLVMGMEKREFTENLQKQRFRVEILPKMPMALLFLLLALSANFNTASALPRPEPPGRVSVGAVFTMDKGSDPVVKLPTWMKADNEQLFGIAQLKDVGKHQVQMKGGRTLSVEVSEEQENFCGQDRFIIWLEIVDPRRMSQLSVEEQFKATQSLLGTLREAGVKSKDVRLFPHSYLARYRTVTETIHELDESTPKADDQIVFLLNISCGELTEQASEVINAVAENGMDFQVIQGSLKVPVQLQQSPTTTKPMDSVKAADDKADSTSSAILVAFILLVILLALVAGLALYWLKQRQAQKRQKQAAEANGKGSTRPAALANSDGVPSKGQATTLSPNESVATATTPMLPANDEEAAAVRSPAGTKKS